MLIKRGLVAGVLLLGFGVPGRPATAQEAPQPPADADRPWAEGVAPEKQAEALQIFSAGNALFDDSQWKAALAKYEEAIAVWDHPAIRYNMAVCHMNLEQWLDAHEDLEPALRYGARPFASKQLHEQALLNQRLLFGRLAEVTLVCEQAGVEVFLDGEALSACPARITKIVSAGRHSVAARKPGHIPETRPLALFGGSKTTEKIKLQPLSARFERRWAWWKPWVPVAAGAVIALAGVPLYRATFHDRDRYDREVLDRCGPIGGCDLNVQEQAQLVADIHPSLEDQKTRENTLAIATLAVGGAAIVTGLVLVALNQPRPVVERAVSPHRSITFAPTVAPGAFGVAVGVSY